MKDSILKLGVCGVLLATVAACQPAHEGNYDDHKTMTDRYFDMMDSNNNGVVTRGETRIYADAEFTFADVNNDGILTREELHMMKERKMAARTDGFSRSKMHSNDPTRGQDFDDDRHSHNPHHRAKTYNSYDRSQGDGEYYYDRSSKRWEQR